MSTIVSIKRDSDNVLDGKGAIWWHWVAMCVFVLSSSINYLDRQVLAAVATSIKAEYGLTNTEYGQVVSVFSLVYTICLPVAGFFIDHVGINTGSVIFLIAWSCAGSATGLTRTFSQLVFMRASLGATQAAGIPSAGKAMAVYLKPEGFALGRALNTVGLTLGSVAAPILAAWLTPRYGWRAVFMFCGGFGLLWVPLWWWTSRRIPPPIQPHSTAPATNVWSIIRDPRLWILAIANALVMTMHTLWTNWTTVYFVHQHGLTEIAANQEYAWIPPLFATGGAFFGGWLTFRWMRQGLTTFAARMRVFWLAVPLLLTTAIIPFLASPSFAVIGIGASFFLCICISTNLNVMPIDLYGARRAAFAVSILTCAYGVMQTFISPVIGTAVDRYGFSVVCFGLSPLPLLAGLMLRRWIK